MLVTLVQARRQLRDPPAADDTEIGEICERATHILTDFLKVPSDSWQSSAGAPESVPPLVEAACLLVVEHLYNGHEVILTQAVKDLVRRVRDPALA